MGENLTSGESKRALKASELNKKKKIKQCQERITNKWNMVRENEKGDVEDE